VTFPSLSLIEKAAHPFAHEPIDVIELQEVRHKVSHRTRLWVGPHDRHLGKAVRQSDFGDWSPLGRVGVEQVFGHLTANDRGKLAAQVLCVHEPEAQVLTTERRMNMRRITGKQNSPSAVCIHKR
jgi:hypothetical protein